MSFALRITAAYLVLAAGWITLGDLIVHRVASGADASLQLQLAKGWLFVTLSSAFIYWLARRAEHRWLSEQASQTAFAAHLEVAREEERRRLAMDIHDEVGAGLSGLRMSLMLLARDVDGAAARARVTTIEEDLGGIIHAVRRLSSGLRPAVLDELGLVAALEELTDDWSRRSECTVELEATSDPSIELIPARGIHVYRVVQEALTNIERHASAGRVRVSLSVEGDTLHVRVVDDGKGFPAIAPGRRSFGVANMRHRAELLAGRLDITAAPGGGTSVLLRVPVSADAPAADA